MLLRAELQLRPVVLVPHVVWLLGHEESVRLAVFAPELRAQDTMHRRVRTVTNTTASNAELGVGQRLAALLAGQRAKFVEFVRGRVRSGADADDIVQQAIVRAVEKAHTLRDESLAVPWFYRILRRTIADHHAQWASTNAKLGEFRAEFEEATPEEVATCACSLGLLDKIRPEYAVVLRRVDIEDESIADVASTLDITTNNATVRLHRARKALRDKLLEACGSDSSRACADCGCDE